MKEVGGVSPCILLTAGLGGRVEQRDQGGSCGLRRCRAQAPGLQVKRATSVHIRRLGGGGVVALVLALAH